MGRVALKPSQAVAELLRSKREDLGLSLREIEKRTAEAGELIPFPTLAKVEQGKVDPGVRRLHLLLKLYKVPLQVVSDLVELEDFAGKLPKHQDGKKLYEEGLQLWKSGETRKGLACLIALQKLSKDAPRERAFRQKAVLSFAIMASSLGKYHLSLELVGNLLLERPEGELLVSAFVQAGRCWNHLGAPEVGLAFLERAEKLCGSDASNERGFVLHQKASTLATMGDYAAASDALSRAIAAYRKAGDAYGESRCFGVKFRILDLEGNHRAALRAAREGIAHAQRNDFTRIRTLRKIDEGRVWLALGDGERSIETLRAALAEAVTDGDRHAEFHVHHGLWKVYSALGQRDQAAFELGAARHYLRFIDETSDEVAEIRALPPEPGHRRRRRARPAQASAAGA